MLRNGITILPVKQLPKELNLIYKYSVVQKGIYFVQLENNI